ncbi:unnamed protein product [Effrenium voratum]|nr:unnamed protein product [Effrenium voratum]
MEVFQRGAVPRAIGECDGRETGEGGAGAEAVRPGTGGFAEGRPSRGEISRSSLQKAEKAEAEKARWKSRKDALEAQLRSLQEQLKNASAKEKQAEEAEQKVDAAKVAALKDKEREAEISAAPAQESGALMTLPLALLGSWSCRFSSGCLCCTSTGSWCPSALCCWARCFCCCLRRPRARPLRWRLW